MRAIEKSKFWGEPTAAHRRPPPREFLEASTESVREKGLVCIGLRGSTPKTLDSLLAATRCCRRKYIGARSSFSLARNGTTPRHNGEQLSHGQGKRCRQRPSIDIEAACIESRRREANCRAEAAVKYEDDLRASSFGLLQTVPV